MGAISLTPELLVKGYLPRQTWWREAKTRRKLTDVHNICSCGHERAAHEHHRAGSESVSYPPGLCTHDRWSNPFHRRSATVRNDIAAHAEMSSERSRLASSFPPLMKPAGHPRSLQFHAGPGSAICRPSSRRPHLFVPCGDDGLECGGGAHSVAPSIAADIIAARISESSTATNWPHLAASYR